MKLYLDKPVIIDLCLSGDLSIRGMDMPNAGAPLPVYSVDTVEEAKELVWLVARQMYDGRMVYSWGRTPLQVQEGGGDAVARLWQIGEELEMIHNALNGEGDLQAVHDLITNKGGGRMSAAMRIRELICRLVGHRVLVDNYGYRYCGRCFDTLPTEEV